jgi:hypothetical protein
MLNVEKLKPNTTEALISRVYNYSLEERLHTLLNKNFLSVKYVMENYIKVEEGNTKKGHLDIHVREQSLNHAINSRQEHLKQALRGITTITYYSMNL